MIYFTIIILSCMWTIIQGEYGTSCVLPNQENGICVPLKSCKNIYQLLIEIQQKENGVSDIDKERILKLQCGSINNSPLICCSQSEVQLNPVAIDLLQNNTCGIYSLDKVAHGSEAALFGFPWMVLLKYDYDDMPFRCSGSLISDQYVLTAAHCIDATTKQLLGVRLGEHQISTVNDCVKKGPKTVCAPPVEDIGIEKIIKHENYTNNLYHDIALLRLDRKVQMQRHIKPICLPIYDHLKESNIYVISGWGGTEKGSHSDVLQVALLPQIDRESCSKLLSKFRFTQDITEGRFCAGSENLVDTCKGDSGGPIGYKGIYNDQPRFIQYGIVSAGVKQCGRISAPSLYTNVSHYMQWITDHMY